jgi:hypothetical protein
MSSSATDQTLYEMSMQPFSDSTPFIDKKVLWCADSNSNSYSSGTVIIETSSLANSGRYFDLQNAVLHIPMVVSMNAQNMTSGDAIDVGTANNCYAIGHKGWHNFISSIQISYNNKEIVQQTNRINDLLTFKLLSTMNRDDLHKHADTWGFSPDIYAHRFADADDDGTPNGIGVTNNRVSGDFDWDAGYQQNPYNTGLADRLYSSNVDNDTDVFTTDNDASQAYRNRYAYSDNNAVWYWDCQLRLKDLSSFFANAPLLRGSFIRIQLTVAQSSFTIRSVPDDAVNGMRLLANPAPTFQGSTCPLMVVSCGVGQGFANIPNTGADDESVNITIQNRIATASVGGTTYRHPMSTCRLYVNTYDLAPQAESDYLSLNPTMTIPFTDAYQYQITSIASGSSFSSLISNGLSSLRGILIIPYYASASHPVGGTGANSITLAEVLSPFDSAPNTTLPFAQLRNLQVQIGGVNCFQESINYDYEFWMNELRENGLNGDAVENLRSGFINKSLFESCMRFYYVNVKRRLEIEDGIPKSIQISGVNASPYPLDLQIYAVFKKQLVVSTSDGAVVTI